MITVQCEQGSPEWHQSRAGAITASMFAEARKRVNGLTDQQQTYVSAMLAGKSETEARADAGYKAAPRADVVGRALAGERVGDYTDAAKNYAFQLAVERLTGEPMESSTFVTWAMRRGTEMEPEARDAHAFETGLTIERAGFVLSDDGLFGASADGLIGEDGGSEYKCLVSPERIRDVLLDRDISEYMDQVQGCMWLTGRKWWHFCLYCPFLAPIGKALTTFPVDRDDDYIEAMESDLIAFNGLVEQYRERLIRPTTRGES